MKTATQIALITYQLITLISFAILSSILTPAILFIFGYKNLKYNHDVTSATLIIIFWLALFAINLMIPFAREKLKIKNIKPGTWHSEKLI